MLTSKDLRGVVGMMPAFTTPDGGDIRSTSTIDVDNLKAGVDRIINDGINAIAATGSFGECYNLLPEEFETIARATVEAVNKRVPVIIGCVSQNSREAVRKVQTAKEAGADGVLLAIPYYLPSTVDNAVRFLHDVAEMFPTLGILIYHNPWLHRITLPVEAFKKISESPNVVGMKDSHRSAIDFMRLMEIVRGKISIFVYQNQYYPYAPYGAAGCWSIDAWMGPWPLLHLRDAIQRGDEATARQAALDLADATARPGEDPQWREAAHKIAIKYAGYCDPGPLRPPFLHVPQYVLDREQRRAERWKELCEKTRPKLQAVATA